MAVTDWLGKPDDDKEVIGRYNINRYHLDLAAAAEPIVPVNIEDIQNISGGAMSYDEIRRLHQGGGSDARVKQYGGMGDGTINMIAGAVDDFLAALLGMTYTAAGDVAVPLRFPNYPLFHLESVCRTEDGSHILSIVYQDCILKPVAPTVNLEQNEIDIPFHYEYEPFYLLSGCEMVLDKWAGDGSTTDFTLSSTPLDMVDSTLEHNAKWDLDNAAFVKVKLSTEDSGIRQRSGVTLTGTTLAFTTAPASGSEVSCLYAKATV